VLEVTPPTRSFNQLRNKTGRDVPSLITVTAPSFSGEHMCLSAFLNGLKSY